MTIRSHLARVTQERDDAHAQLRAVREQLAEMERYLHSAKFQGPDADYVHVRTDILPKIRTARFATIF